MRTLYRMLLTVAAVAFPAWATHVAVLETTAGSGVITLEEKQYLTDVFRSEAVKVLPAEQNYTIMTRENIQQMLPPGKAIEECEGSCLVETGKNIAADYICQARVGNFGGALTLSAELYETAGNKLIATINGQGANVNELLIIIKEKSPDFFRKIKGPSGFAGIGAFDGVGEYSYAGRKQFIVEIVSTPTGALPTIDGRGIPKCTSTPCKVQVEEGNHRIVMSKEHFDDAEIVVDIKENNQKIDLTLLPAYGWFEARPILAGKAASRGELGVTVDGNRESQRKVRLDPGIHSVLLSHPCYDPVEFKVSIAKQKTEIFDKEMARGKGGLELTAEYNGEPQSVTVVIDGVESGSTPYSGEVPLCADVVLKGNGWTEKVDVTPKWHEVVHVTHPLTHGQGVAMSKNDSIRARAQAAYDELDGKPSARVGGNIPTNVDENESKTTKWVLLGISSAATITGVVLAVVGNSKAKDASEKTYSSKKEFESYREDAKSGQTLRSVGIGIAIVGAIGVGVSFAF